MIHEALIVRKQTMPGKVAPRYHDAKKIMQSVSGRVFTVKCDDKEIKILQADENIELVAFPGNLPEAMPGGLSDAEQLFVKAWIERQRPKQRYGEGLNWNAGSDMLPPDKGGD